MPRFSVLSRLPQMPPVVLALALALAIMPHRAPAVGTYLGVNYQAKLTTATGGLPLNGSHTLYFSIWQGGSAGVADSGFKMYEESAVVTATNGIVDHTVGTGSILLGGPLDPSMFVTDNFMYLQVGIDSAANPVLPRTRLGAAPLAAKAFSSVDGVPQGYSIVSNYPNSPPGFTETGKPLYNPWLYLKRMVTARTSLAVAPANGKIYAIGGMLSGGAVSDANEEYDPDKNLWAVKAVLPTARRDVCAVGLGGLIYVTGGFDLFSMHKLTHSYNPNTNTWTPKANMNFERRYHCMTTYGGKIYVFGGANNTSGVLQSVEEYNPNTNVWTPKADIPTARQGAVAAELYGNIHVIGGASGPYTEGVHEVYNPATNSWTTATSCPLGMYFAGATVIDNRIYVIGGQFGINLADVRIYDPATDSWTVGEPMPEERTSLGVTSDNGRIYAIGGSDFNSAVSPLNRALDPTVYYVHQKN
ncbi:MAG: hypothetical protein K1X53_09910 [Candidatus Sumerlaeaceae bacterium]|nr:hypothetical protein [Candidatus Sumerlaeaceae bacterium]